GIAILGFAGRTADVLGVPLPPDQVYLRLVGILLLVLGSVYVLPARDPLRFLPVIVVSAAGRVAGSAYLVWAWAHGEPPAFLVLGLVDLAFGLAQGALVLRLRAS